MHQQFATDPKRQSRFHKFCSCSTLNRSTQFAFGVLDAITAVILPMWPVTSNLETIFATFSDVTDKQGKNLEIQWGFDKQAD